MGNLDSKLSAYYAISEENLDSKNGDDSFHLQNSFKNSPSIWNVRRTNFNNEFKNATLFEFNSIKFTVNDSKKVPTKNFTFALNQIKTLKTLRHPNIVKYFYSEEPSIVTASNASKCLLITESIRPLPTLISDLSNEQILRGIYSITNAVNFLHEKVQLSHNNLSEHCIYLNSKQTWKLNDFELALNFSHLSSESLRPIYELKNKNAITPEEEAEILSNNASQSKFDSELKQSPHSIDAYGWAMLVLTLLPKKTTTAPPINNSLIDEKLDEYLDELELFLSKEADSRPRLKFALSMRLFSFMSNTLTVDNSKLDDQTESKFDIFKISNLDELNANFDPLNDYLKNLIQTELEQKESAFLSERLIEFFLSPFMFFSNKVRAKILPCILIPRHFDHDLTRFNVNNFCFLFFYKNVLNLGEKKKNEADETECRNEDNSGCLIEPFIEPDKYKAFVLPRVLNLFSIHSAQIRIGLLQYFPFYVSQINDMDTLQYEILPEILLGLKDKNDELVSLSFACLSILVQILGSEIVVGKHASNQRFKIFSDNIPKVTKKKEKVKIQGSKKIIYLNVKKKTNSVENDSRNKTLENPAFTEVKKMVKNLSFTNKPIEISSRKDSAKNLDSYLSSSLNDKKFTASFDEEILINDESIKANKLFSDSMIALHDENEVFSKVNFNEDDDWSSDFGWSQENSANNNENLASKQIEANSASLVSLAGSFLNNEKIPTKFTQQNVKNDLEFCSELDIKNLKIVKKKEDSRENLIESFLNEMQPVIKTQSSDVVSMRSDEVKSGGEPSKMKLANNSANNLSTELKPIEQIQLITMKNSAVSSSLSQIGNSWECEEIIDLDEL